MAFAAVVLAACVVVMGAWVRLTNAGLGCPDWPGCYGQLHPESDAGAKPWHEMIHRYAAGLLVLSIGALAWLSFRNRSDARQPLMPAVALVGLVILQAALGAFTVTWLLKPLIVTLHLLGGLATLAVLTWLATRPSTDASERSTDARPALGHSLRAAAYVAFAILAVQIALGGWTSSNYAAVACPDFPTCRGSYSPPMDFRDAFVLWRGLGINYEGGVLASPARTAIHVAHRIGALVAGTALVLLGVAALRARARPLRICGIWLIAAVCTQILIGISVVHWGVPLTLATAHNAGAALLVITMTRLLRKLT